MDTGLMSRRYAKALADYSSERKEEARVYGEIQQLSKLYRQEHLLLEALQSPVLPVEEKVSAFSHLSPTPLSKSLEDFIRLVIRHHRESSLYLMFLSFMDLYRERHNIREAELVTASPVGEEVEEALRKRVQEWSKCTIDFNRKVHPALIGGIIFRMGDDLIDASLSTQIRLLRNRLGNEPIRKI